MPLMECQIDGKDGFKYGSSGVCYPHDGSDVGKKRAKKAAIKQAIAIGGGKAPKDLSELDGFVRELAGDDASVEDALEVVALAMEAERELAAESKDDLPTVTLKAVELLSAGGPYFGQGSPKGGDHFDEKFLKKLAADTARLVDEYRELKPPQKVGHTRAQKLLGASGLKVGDGVAGDEKPAAGWLTNVRYDADAKKIVADVVATPRKLSRLIRAGAYRTRSVEIQTLTSQTDKKKYRVISAFAWLGEKAPAVRTLDDVVALYSEEALEPTPIDDALVVALEETGAPDEDSEVLAALAVYDEATDDRVELASGDLAWKPEEGYGWIRDKVNAALNPNGMVSRYWVRDVADGKALVTEYNAGESAAYVVPFTLGDGDVTVSPSSDWTKVEQAWVDATPAQLAARTAADLVALGDAALEAFDEQTRDAVRVLASSADTSADMPETKTQNQSPSLSDEQVDKFAEVFGIDEADAAKKREAVVEKLSEVVPAKPADDEKPTPTPTALSAAEAEVLRAKAERGDRAYEQLRETRQTNAIEAALKDGRLDPAKKDFWVTQFAEIDDDDRVIALLEQLPANDEFKRVYAVESSEDGDAETIGDAAYADMMGAFGYETDELPTLAGKGA